MEEFKCVTFRKSSQAEVLIRSHVLPTSKVIAFGIAITDLSVMNPADALDFDEASEEIIQQNLQSKNNLAFEYARGIGFLSVDVDKQHWFNF